MKRHLLTLFTASLLFIQGTTVPVQADDTDIYVNPTPVAGSEPLVMFNIDYRANMVSTKCNSGAVASAAALATACGYSTELATALFTDGAAANSKISLYELIRAALKVVFSSLEGVKVGLMMSHEGNNSCNGPGPTGCSNGAMIMQGFESMVDGDANGNKAAFLAKLKNIPATEDFSAGPDFHPFQLKETYFEFFRYLTGQNILNGHNAWRDYDDQTNCGGSDKPQTCTFYGSPARTPDVVNLDGKLTDGSTLDASGERMWTQHQTSTGFTYYPGWDSDSTGGDAVENGSHTKYVSPLDSATDCTKIYVINIAFGTANSDNDADGNIQATKASQGMGITLAGSNTQAQVIEFMNDADLADATNGFAKDNGGNLIDIDGTQNVISYFLTETANNTQNTWAASGGTGSAIELGSDGDTIIDTITTIFDSILSVSTTFVAPSVPVNVFNRSETENDVFLALFKADENALPFWPGNVKHLNIAPVTVTDPNTGQTIDTFELQDALNVAAIDTDGRIKLDALTVWTDTGDTDLDGALEDEATDDRDGRAVTRGGAGQQMPGYLSVAGRNPGSANSANIRQVYTEATNTCTPDGNTPATNCTLMALDWSESVGDTLWTPLFRELMYDDPTFPTSGTTPTFPDIHTHYQARLLAWARGANVGSFADATNNFTFGGATNGYRDWWMGDPLHSRPLTINYGARSGYSTSDPDIRVLVGTNDGFFRMIKNTAGGVAGSAGQEVWAFAPRETMPIWWRLENNLAVTNPVHPISVDGSASVLIIDHDNDGTIELPDGNGDYDKVYIFFGLRRGGKSYYAFDISNPDAAPVYLWRISKYANPVRHDNSAINTSFAQLGQTWSKPVVGYKKLDLDGDTYFNDGIIDRDGDNVNETVAVLIFGGGYNGDDFGDNLADDDSAAPLDTDPGPNWQDNTGLGKDQANRSFNASTTIAVGTDDRTASNEEGNALFMVNAATGELIWKAVYGVSDNVYTSSSKSVSHTALTDSIPSEVSAIDSTGDNYFDRVYTGDTGGRVLRFDINGTDPSTWTTTVLLNAGRHVSGASNRANDRRFFNRPDIVFAAQGATIFDAIIIGSGDRETPKDTDVSNAFFMIKDTNTLSGSPPSTTLTHSNTVSDQDLGDVTDNCLQTDSCVTDPDLTHGWFFDLPTVGDSGEKALSPAVTLGGIIFFSTFSPTSGGSCGLSEGSGKQFAVDLFDATAPYNYNTANDGSSAYPEDRFDVIESGGIPVEPVPLGDDILLFQGQAGEETIQNTGALTSWRTFWYEKDFN